MDEEKLKPHQWTNKDGEVLVLRYCNHAGESDGQNDRPVFRHPMTVGESVTAPDWDPAGRCGGGIHGWPLGLGIGDGKDADWTALWQVYGVQPPDIVGEIEGGQKCKFRTGALRFKGPWYAATEYVLSTQIAWVQYNARGSASATGARGSASATGWRGSASATGARGSASATGARGSASATGESGSASATGESGSASATGWSGSASATGASGSASATGARGSASATGWRGSASATLAAQVTGLEGQAKAGKYGCIALAWWNPRKDRVEMHCALVGPGRLKPDTWYTLNEAGKFVEAK